MALSWKKLGWPLREPQWTLTQGKLNLTGALRDYRLTLNTEAGGPELPPVGIELAASGNLEQARIEPLTLVLPQGETQLTGDIGWADGVRWQGELTLNEVDPGAFAEGFEGRLNGRIDSRFTLNGNQWRLEAGPEVKGVLRNHPLSLTGQIRLDQDLAGQVEDLVLTNGNNRLAVSGRIDERWDLNGRLTAPDLAVYAPACMGTLPATLM
ncbi:hypothetical protein MBH78_20135 [Oceanimonas sp. NS1]|nr:hypothetical protein [Oceanimonas sp. NS1]